MERYFE